MKRLFIAVAVMVLAFAVAASGQTTDQKAQPSQAPAQAGQQQMQMGCGMMGGGGGKMGGMMCGMMHHGMMMDDMIDVMTEMMKIQEKLVKGVSPSEKEAILKDMARLSGRLEQMKKTAAMPMMHNMPMGAGSDQPSAQQKTQEKKEPEKPMTHQH